MGIFTIVASVIAIATVLLMVALIVYYNKKLKIINEEVRVYKNANEYQEEAVVVFSDNFHLLMANKSARKILQLNPYKENEPIPKEVKIQVGKSDIFTLQELYEKQSRLNNGTIHVENAVMTVGGKRHHVNLHIEKMFWREKAALSCIFQDISHKVLESEMMTKVGEIDYLTDLSSQFKANADINKLVITAQRENRKIAFYIFGVHEYEKLKSTFGFGYTNTILKGLAEFLKNMDGPKTKSYRLDCDNFLHMIEDVTSNDEIYEIGADLKKNLNGYFAAKIKNTNLRFSIGVVVFPEHGRNAAKLLDHAFIALESAKQEDSRVPLALFKSEFNNIQEIERNRVDEMRLGIKKGEFEVYYQPVMDLQSSKLVSAEALVRWNHPAHGVLLPSEFMNLAKVSGLIINIGEFVLEEVAKQHRKWKSFGFMDIEISINLSAKELLTYQLADKLKAIFEEMAINPEYFNLDMSERDAIEDTTKTDKEFAMLKSLGVNLSLDHFGVGGSSIERLKKLPIHSLKVDYALTKNIDKDLYHQELFKAIVLLAKTLNIKVIACGIETKAQAEILKTLGCDYALGHFFAKPAPAYEFQVMLPKK